MISGWNGGAQEMYGIPKEQAIAKPIHSLLLTRNHRPTVELMDIRHRTGLGREVVHTGAGGSGIVAESRHVLEKSETGATASS